MVSSEKGKFKHKQEHEDKQSGRLKQPNASRRQRLKNINVKSIKQIVSEAPEQSRFPRTWIWM